MGRGRVSGRRSGSGSGFRTVVLFGFRDGGSGFRSDFGTRVGVGFRGWGWVLGWRLGSGFGTRVGVNAMQN